MVSSSFSAVPGLPILHSRDLVNWDLVNHALPRLVPEDVFASPQHGAGVWAPAIRHHAGKYWIYYPDPDYGIYLITATDPRGAWSAPVLVKAGQGTDRSLPVMGRRRQRLSDPRVRAEPRRVRQRAAPQSPHPPTARASRDAGRIVIDGNTSDAKRLHDARGSEALQAQRLVLRLRAGGRREAGLAVGLSLPSTSMDRMKIASSSRRARPTSTARTRERSSTRRPASGGSSTSRTPRPTGASCTCSRSPGATTGRSSGTMVTAMARESRAGRGGSRRCQRRDRRAVRRRMTFADRRLGLQWQWQANPRQGWWSFPKAAGRASARCQSIQPVVAPNLLLQKFPAPAFTCDRDHGHFRPSRWRARRADRLRRRLRVGRRAEAW